MLSVIAFGGICASSAEICGTPFNARNKSFVSFKWRETVIHEEKSLDLEMWGFFP